MKSRKSGALNFSIPVLAVVLVFSSCGRKETATPADDSVVTISSMEQLQAVIQTAPDRLLVFDLYADWCRPCKILSPIYSSLASDHKQRASFYRINVDKSPDLAAAFGVRGIPYVVFVKEGEAFHALTGLNPRESYESVIMACGNDEPLAKCKAGLQS